MRPYPLFKVFVHTVAPAGTLDFKDDFSAARIVLDPVPRDDSVELRALLDEALFTIAAAKTTPCIT
jgi:hypothetical protein